MTDFKTRIDPEPLPPKDWIAVEKIEKDKRGKEELLKKNEGKGNPKLILFSSLIVFARKILTLLSSNRSRSAAFLVDTAQGLIEYLNAFKKTLQTLSAEDKGYNPEYIQEFSDAWHNLLEGIAALEWLERKKSEEKTRIKKIVDTIGCYPSGEEHSLGFYLSEFAGKEWLPFPFMDLLHALHEEKNNLASWISEIDQIIDSLRPKSLDS